jgi:hypothetical protein
MQTAHLWDKLHLHRAKITFGLCLLVSVSSFAQRKIDINNPNYDNRKISYGFSIGVHSSMYKVRYSDAFTSPTYDHLQAIQTNMGPGFSLGFITNLKLGDNFDIRTQPAFAFFERNLRYDYIDGTSEEQIIETVMLEFPVLLKYRSERRGNIRMYMIGGVKPSWEASGKNDVQGVVDEVPIRKGDVALEAGFGFDLYFPYFKFSPELRFSKGMRNMLGSEINAYSEGIRSLKTNTVTLYLLFN